MEKNSMAFKCTWLKINSLLNISLLRVGEVDRMYPDCCRYDTFY